MLEVVALWAFAGGVIRGLAGFFNCEKPAKKNLPIVLAITGFLGIVSGFAVFFFETDFYMLVYWKMSFMAGLIGYVGVDLMNSMFTILRQRRICI